MANNSDSNSDSDDIVLVEETKSRKRKSTSNLDDDLDDLLLESNNFRKRKSLVAAAADSIQTKASNSINQRKLLLADKIDRLCEFAQLLMHCLLFKINYYNKKTHFDKLLKYNTIVYVII